MGVDGQEKPFGIIQVPPNLQIQGKEIQLNSIRLLSVVSKWIGMVDEWPAFMKEFSALGYNMVHFTPLQQRGSSNSPYSIADHLKLSNDLGKDMNLDALGRAVENFEHRYQMLCMIDIVWNHISCDSHYLKEHPEIGYNLQNSPHLKMAYDLDEGILEFSRNMHNEYGLNPSISSEEDLRRVMKIFLENFIPKMQLWEYFVINVSQHVDKLEHMVRDKVCLIHECPHYLSKRVPVDPSKIVAAIRNDGKDDRFSNYLDMDLVAKAYACDIKNVLNAPTESERSMRLSKLLTDFRSILDGINYDRYRIYDEKIQITYRNILGRVKYERLDSHGPKLGAISEKCPLVSTYFTRVQDDNGNVLAFANNGWIWNADPLVNFAEASSDAYFTRDIIIWGDCVKLRYGKGPEDSPWLWNYMTEYSQKMSSIFHAFRIDNCHSTPLHLADYLLKKAREVRPELYVCAELFTGSPDRDLEFIGDLGINSLIREAMASWSPADLGRNAVEYGGCALGSFSSSSGVQLKPHAVFADCTHDNETPSQRRTAIDALPNSAVVAMGNCATASVLGYDLLVPSHINVVKDLRRFDPLALAEKGMGPAKKLLNDVHKSMISEGYTEIYGNESENVLTIIRENPVTRNSYFLMCYPAFSSDVSPKDSVLEFEGCHVKVMMSGRLSQLGPAKENASLFTGIDSKLDLSQNKLLEGMGWVEGSGSTTKIYIKSLMPGSFVLLHRCPSDEFKSALDTFARTELWTGLKEIASKFTLNDLNLVMYRCEEEERDSLRPGGVYEVPGYGKLPYCGIAGFYVSAREILEDNLLDHSMCHNIRAGPWMMDYIIERLKPYPSLTNMYSWLSELFGMIKSMPSYLHPKHFCEAIVKVYDVLAQQALNLMGINGSPEEFKSQLALGSVQMLGSVQSTGLTPRNGQVSMSAGLPHFTTHHMRVWGRDVFISFKGIFLLVNRFEEAREHLMAFAGCLYQGLIPNLLDSGRRPRYNARDATWFFLQALQDYCKMAPQGLGILDMDVPMRFNDDIYTDFDDPLIYTKSKKMSEIVKAILLKHCKGIKFTEWRAGKELDNVMSEDGFQVNAGIDQETGFVYGGNPWNCGTWMDKMGESHVAGNVGYPATPRDGSAIELTALLASTCSWLSNINQFKDCKLEFPDGSSLTIEHLLGRIQENFEKCFHVPADSALDSDHSIPNPAFISRRGIYRDTYHASNALWDFRMRPNFLTAMKVAPFLFCREKAREAIDQAERILWGPVGMKTLDPEDPSYRPNYSQAENKDYYTSKGFNYHQGPEWVWCFGQFLTAWIHFNQDVFSREELRSRVLLAVRPHMKLIRSGYLGLPELTNAEGALCEDSCRTQAWSMATLLEAILSIE